MGKVAIIPSGTWMADQVSDGNAAGVFFGKNTVNDMMEAVEQAINDRQRLLDEARRRAGPFREENSCASNLDGMLKLAEQPCDMRLSYIPMTDATTMLGLQHYLGQGWADAEEDMGVWSDGDRAELNFSIKPAKKRLFFYAQVKPFLTRSHSRIEVSLTANGVSVAMWPFDSAQLRGRKWLWCQAEIPEDIAATGDIRLVLDINSPASPLELGLSTDPRKLGIALHQFSLQAEELDSRLAAVEPPEKFSRRLVGWFKRHR
jgi:hypothetical protein